MGVIIFYSLWLVQVEKMNAEKNLEMYDTYRVKETERLPLVMHSESINSPLSCVFFTKRQFKTLKMLRFNNIRLKRIFVVKIIDEINCSMNCSNHYILYC